MTASQSISAFTKEPQRVSSRDIIKFHNSQKIRLTDPVRSWRDAVVSKLNELVALERGWDGYQAGPVSFENASFALRMLEACCGVDAPMPQIVPGVVGDLQVEWHIGNTDIELDIRGPNNVHAWICNEQTGPNGHEFALTNDFTIVAKWLRDLSGSPDGSFIAAA